jgi:putative tricarboxylic transport membrane protein
MQSTRAQGALIGVLMLVAGLAYFYMTASLPRRETSGIVDATFFPYVLATLMLLLGALQLLGALRAGGASAGTASVLRDPEPEVETDRISYATVLITLALIAGFAAALQPLGFPIAAAIYLFLQFIVLRPVHRNFGYPVYAGLAVACALIIFVTFRYGFQLLLPAGPLAPFLP